MLRAFVTALIAAVGIMGLEAAHGKHASKGDPKKEHEKEKHGSDQGKLERKL